MIDVYARELQIAKVINLITFVVHCVSHEGRGSSMLDVAAALTCDSAAPLSIVLPAISFPPHSIHTAYMYALIVALQRLNRSLVYT